MNAFAIGFVCGVGAVSLLAWAACRAAAKADEAMEATYTALFSEYLPDHEIPPEVMEAVKEALEERANYQPPPNYATLY